MPGVMSFLDTYRRVDDDDHDDDDDDLRRMEAAGGCMVGTWSNCDVMMPMTMMVGCVRMCRKSISYPCRKVTMIDKYKVRSVFDNVFL